MIVEEGEDEGEDEDDNGMENIKNQNAAIVAF